MEKMLVTQALNELKTLDSKIDKAIGQAELVSSAKTCDKNVKPNKSKEDFSSEAKAAFQKINDLIARRESIKAAVIQSNAETYVDICGEKQTVAKVLDLKSSILYRSTLLSRMKSQYANALANTEKQNAAMQNKIDSLVATAFGKESKTNIKPDDYSSIADPYKANNEYSLVDPLGISKRIEDEEKYIADFTANVDTILQVSNCTTWIEI